MTISRTASHGTPSFDQPRQYDAVLVMSFGGPEGMADVMPFLETVTRGRNLPRERLLEVAHHYEHFGGVSPLNRQNRDLVHKLEAEISSRGHALAVYFGNRNWHPLVTDTVRRMRDDGVKRALVFVTAGFSCYSGCRQYREDIIRAVEAVGGGAPAFDKLRVFYNHPGFIEANVDHLRTGLERVSAGRRADVRAVFTAHSIPLAMAKASDYERQLAEASRLVAEGAGVREHDLVYQSRSGPPQVPWLGPDILHRLVELAERGVQAVVVHPIGFISDHIEVLWDLDQEAREKAQALGLEFVRSATAGTHAAFVRMVRELIEERITPNPVRRAAGRFGPNHDICPVDCCLVGGKGR
ncbi:MAG: ferrochelatase [Gemmatimonadetes bacterium]|nr:ferrochelatase [Gemmatimonadota bacterium]